MEQSKPRHWCCYIAQDGGRKQGEPCKVDARWQIYSQKPGLAPYDCTTDACTEHVGVMLDDAEQHIITPIEE